MAKVSETPGCQGCPLARLYPQNNFVPLQLGGSKRLAIGESPGEEESIQLRPFVGAAGKWLEGMYRKAGIQKDEVTLVNCINCRPPDNVFPTDSDARSYISEAEAATAVAHCLEAHVWPVVRGRDWERIDLLGGHALHYIAGKDGIFTWRGSPVAVKGEAKPRCVPTLHPSYIARDQSMIPVVVNDFKKNTNVPPEHYDVSPSLEALRAFTATEFAFDIENDPKTSEVFLVGLTSKAFTAVVVPFHGAYREEIKRIFASAKVIYGQNIIQHDLPILALEQNHRVTVSDDCQVWDIMLLQHLLFPDLPHDLEFIASQFTNKPCWKHEGRGNPAKGIPHASDYWEKRNARDTDVTWQIGKVLVPMAKAAGVADLYNYVQWPLGRICRLMRDTGFKVDPNRIGAVRTQLKADMAAEEGHLPEKLRTHMVPIRKRQRAPEGTLSPKTGKPIKFVMVDAEEELVPWASSLVVQAYLYDELKLPQQLHVKTGEITVDKTALEKLYRKTQKREIRAINKLRKYATLINSFCKETMQSVSRMYPHFNVHGTSSGRLSSSDPNLQNIPEAARYIYVPSHAGWKIVEADFSGIENRLVAYFAGDQERLARLAQPGFNEHKFIASMFFNIPYETIEKDNDKDAPYGKAKRINHGTGYGMGAQKISKLYDMEFKEVKDLLFKWKQINACTVRWQSEVGERAKSAGLLTTPFARKRWFYTSSYFTESLSFLPQSSAADIIFRAMLGLMYERIGWPVERVLKVVGHVKAIPQPARLLLQVHDSLLFECPGELVDTLVATIKYVMEQPWPELGGLIIPVEVKVGNSWGETKPYTLPALKAAA